MVVLGLCSLLCSPRPPTSSLACWDSPGSLGSLQPEDPLSKSPPTQMRHCTTTSESAEHIGGLTWEALPLGLGQRCCPGTPAGGKGSFRGQCGRDHLRGIWVLMAAESRELTQSHQVLRVWSHLGCAGTTVIFVCLPRTQLGSITWRDPDPPMSELC